MMMTRRAESGDLPAMAHLWAERQSLRGLRLNREAWMSELRSRLTDGQSGVFVCLKDERVCGFAAGQVDERTAQLDALAVDVHGLGGGVGRALWDVVRTWAVEGGLQRLRVENPRHNAVEGAFWRSLGARTEGDVAWLIISFGG